MENYEKKLLAALVEKYRKSKKDSGTNVITRRTRITPDKLYKGYRQLIAAYETGSPAAGHVCEKLKGMLGENRTSWLRLKSLEKQDRYRYRDTVLYMLERNVKLEQEIVSFYVEENEHMDEDV